MIKRFFILLLAIVASVGMSWAQNPSGTCGGGLTWVINDGVLTVSYDGSGTGLMDDGNGGNGGPFSEYREQITSVVLPEGLKNLGAYAFYDNDKITSITIPNSVTEIRIKAFEGCDSLKNVIIGSGVTNIVNYSFRGCTSLMSMQFLGATAPTIENVAINNVDKLQQILCPCGSSASYISAVSGSLANISGKIHEAVAGGLCGEHLAWNLSCDGALTISYDGTGTGVMNDYDIPKDNSAPWYANRENITSVSLPEGIKTIGKDAFRDCVNLTTVTIPNSVTTIGESAFVTVEHLETVTIGTGITSIVNGAFYGNAELTTVTCSATTPPSIGMMVFGSCPNLEHIYVPAASVDAYKTAWSDYASIISAAGGGSTTDPIVIATNTEQSSYTQGSITVSVNYVGDSDGFRLNDDNSASISNSGSSTISKIELVPGWFLNKHSYVRANGAEPNSSSEELITFLNVNSNEVTLSCSVSICIKEVRIYFGEAGGGSSAPSWVLAGDAWDEDTKTLTVNSNPGYEAYYQNTQIEHLIISDGVTTIGESAFDECTALLSVVIGNDVTNIEAYAFDECRAMTSLTIGNKVQTIGESAFGSCESLTSVIIPNSVTSIGESAFDTCDKISSLTIGNSVQTIGEDAFTNCSALTDVTIPASVENIGNWFFRNCENLTTITCEATTPPTLGANAFFDCDKLEHIYVPAASVATYKAADNWATKEAIISAIPVNQLYMEVDGTAGTLKWGLAGSNPVYDGNVIQYDNRKDITTLTIDESCQNHTLTSFYNLFYVFKALTTINGIENLATANVESMRYMFYDCQSLTSLDLSSFNTANVTDMKGMFNGCSNLTTIYVGDDWNTSAVTNGGAMFYGCTNLPNYDSGATGVDKAYVGAGGYLSAMLTPADVMALISAIGEVEYTAESKAKIDAARAAYDGLSESDKALVTNYSTLTNAETAYADAKQAADQAAADPVKDLIAALPNPVQESDLKLSVYNKVQEARAAYDALTADQKALVTNLAILEAAEAAFAPYVGGMPAEALSGKFTINAGGDQIAFAKGNLQATTTDLGEHWTWGFAANQWDIIGNAAANNAVNGKGTVSDNGTVDLFGWSTPTTYYGIHNSTNSDYYSGDFKEWGENITGAEWKTLSPNDWIYIISNRADAAQKHGQATVNGVNGYIFLPDEWEIPSGLSFTAKPNNWTANVYDGDAWTAMENAGAVFLPKSPWRSGNTVNTLTAGYYWSSDYNSYSQAMAYSFQEDASIKGTGINRFAGIPVRLVTAGGASPIADAQAAVDLINAIPTPVTFVEICGNAIEAARAAVDALGANASLIDDADIQKLTNAEAAWTALIPDPVVLPTVKYAVCNVPDGWAVTANGDAVLPINGRYHIADGQTVVLTPPASKDAESITSAEEAGLIGSGTAEDPYLIYTVANWNAVAAKVNDGTQAAPNCRQMANLNGVTTVMGNSESKPFKGIYDGNGFVFSNINLSITSGENPLGLFGCVNDASAVVKNVVVAGGTVSSTSQNVGAIVGQLNGGTVQYCANYATVSSSYNGKVRMGGIVGWMRSAGGDNNRVDHCINYGNVSGVGYVGGITGSCGAGYVSYCQNYGSISSSGTDDGTKGSAAGIIGWYNLTDDTKVTYNHNGGNITEATNGYNPSRYIIANTNNISLPGSNSYLSSLTLTIGSTNYTGAELATHDLNAQALAINPEGITISGITYAYGVAAPIAPAPGTNPGTDPAKQPNRTWQFTMPSHNIGLAVTIIPKLPGAFSINANGDKVQFAKGNLQATTTDLGANWTWDFAPNQWSLIGDAVANNAINGNKKVSANGTVDLFGWSTAATYYGINDSWKNDDYTGDFVDWGALMGTEWHTLSRAEFRYIVFDRAQAFNKQGKATVNGVRGYIFLPDEWELPSGLSFTPSPGDYTTNQYDGANWEAMEAAGAVFLPAAGDRKGTDIYMYDYGWYWTSTSTVDDKAYYLYFYEVGRDFVEHNRYDAKSVRLVTTAPKTPSDVMALIDAIGTVDSTPESKAKIDAAREAYETLSDADKALVTNYETLTNAETAYNNLFAQDVIDKIALLPNPVQESDLKLSVYNKVVDARAAYDALTAEQKALVTNYPILTAAEDAFNALPPVGSETVITWDKNTGIEEIGTHTTTPAYEGITLSTKGGMFGPNSDMLRFYISISDICFEFANTLGANFSKIVLSSTSEIPSTRLDDMGEGWVASSDKKIATWTGDAETVKIWNGITATSYWDVNTLQFTLGSSVSPIAAAQAAVDLINAIPDPVTLDEACVKAIKDAREAVTALGENASLIDETDMAKLTKAEADLTALNQAEAGKVVAKINEIPSPMTTENTKLSVYQKVQDARAAYDALTAEQKALVEAATLKRLTDAEDAFAAIGGGGGVGFTINAEGDKITFAPGNLQGTYSGTNWSWAFAAHQWDYIGNAAGNTTVQENATLSSDGTFDLFGWVGASSNWTGLKIYGITSSKAYNNVDGYGNIGDDALKGDWSELANSAELGGRNDWRMLTKAEWDYLFRTRTNAALLFGLGTVNGVNGMIMLPDNWTTPDGATFVASTTQGLVDKSYAFVNDNENNFTHNTYTTDQWSVMEAAGAIFLPAAGYREGTLVKEAGTHGNYWTANAYEKSRSINVRFENKYFYTDYNDYRNDGQSIRLAAPVAYSPIDAAQAAVDLINAIPDPVTLDEACVKAIKDAREAVTALGENASLIDETDMDKLTKAEADYTNLIKAGADAVIAKINNIPQPVTLKLATGDSIQNARAAYDALTADQKPLVTNYDVLTAAEADWAGLINVAPAGALSGKYTINAGGDVIYFAHGNLQYTRENLDADWSTGTFRLATNQYDLIEAEKTYPAAYCTDNYGDKTAVGLFGWGTWGEGKTPNLTSSDRTLYTWSTDFSGTLEGTNTWRTLSKDEWVYLLAHNNQSYATVHGVNGLLIAPDGKDIDGKSMADWVVINDETWTTMQNDGYLFLPACGQRSQMSATANITTGDQGEEVLYYSSTQYSDAAAHNIWYKPGQDPAAADYSNKRQAFGVRLVSAGVNPLDQVQAVKDLIDAIPAEITLDAACVNAIQAARAGYDALDDDAKAILDAADVKKLTDAEQALKDLNQAEADKVIAKINNIPLPVELKLATRDSIEGARAAYDALTAEQKALVPADVYKKLTDAEAALADLAPTPTPVPVTPTVWDMNELKVGDIIYEGDQLTNMSSPRYINNVEIIRDTKCPYTLMKSAGETSYVLKDKDGSYLFTDGSLAITPASVGLLVTNADHGDINVVVYSLANVLDSAQHVKDLIDAIPTPVEYPTSGPAIAAALVAYNQLSDAAKGALDADDVQKMTDAAAQYAALDAIAAIEAIPAEIVYDPLVKAAIETAREKYDALIDASKALVPEDKVHKLTNAEQAWAILVAKIEHNVSYIGKDGELKHETVALLHIPDPAPDFNGFEFDQWIVKAGDFLEEGLRIQASYTPIITTKPAAFDTLVYNGTAQTLIEAGVAKEGHIEYRLNDGEWSTELPKADMAAVYAVYYKLVREAHEDYMAGSVNVTIAKAPVAYTAPAAYDTLVYNAANQTLIAAGQTNDGTFEYSLDPTLLDSWKTELPQAMSAGTHNVYYRVQGDLNHLDSVAATPVVVTIAKAELTATADDKNVIYGDAVPEYSVTYAGWQGTDTITALTGEIAFACDYTPTSNVGTFAITPSGVSAENYTITFVNGKVTVAKAESFCAAPVAYDTLVYNGIAQTLIEAATPMGGEVQYSLDTALLGSWSTALPQTKDAGAYKVFYRVKGDLNHNDANYEEPVEVSIAKAPLTISANAKAVIYGDSVPAYDVTYTGFKGIDTDTVVSGLAYTCEYAPTSNVGEYTITPHSATAANYTISYTNGKVTVGKAALMITAEDKNVIYGDAVPTYTATYSGWKNSDDASVVSNLAYTCDYAPTSSIGEYTITPNSATATNYAISYTNGKVTVSKAVLTITANDTVMIYGDEAPAFTASYSGWLNGDDETLVSGLQFSTPYKPGSPIGTYAIHPDSATALNYQITFADGKLTVNKAIVKVKDAQVHEAKFADGHAGAEVTDKGTLNGVKLNDPLNHVTTASFSSAEVSEHLTITLFYELTGDAALLNNYDLQPTSEIFTTEGVIIEPFHPDTTQRTPGEEQSAEDQTVVQEGIEVYAYGYCEGDNVGLKYHLNSGIPDQYKINFADSILFKNVDWTDLDEKGADGVIYIDVPVNAPTGDYQMTVYFRDSRFEWLPSQALNVTFHVNLPETYVKPLFDNTIVLVDTCDCFTDIQWYYRETSSDPWAPIPGATGHYYRPENGTKLTGEYFVSAKMNGVPTYTCGQEDMETLYGADKNQPQAQVSAYPNPVESNTTVTIQNSTNWNHNLRVVNLMGIEVLNTAFEGDETVVNMSGFVSGNYMISVDGITVKVMKK